VPDNTASVTLAFFLAIALWSKALGVECSHCHVDGNLTAASKPNFEFAQRMNRMVATLNAGLLKDVAAVSCWTCHRGQAIPPRLARESWEKIRAEHAAEFEGRPNRAIAMSVYAASLGVDCSHCHEVDRASNTKPQKALVREKMLPIFEEIPKHFDEAVRTPVTQCYMCHQGRVKPERALRNSG
jgi:formate-dependent nitrite reductase cytochrome c552 subunit